jgi:hypothetical protein
MVDMEWAPLEGPYSLRSETAKMQAERDYRHDWLKQVDNAIAEAGDDRDKQRETIDRIELELGQQAAAYAESRFIEENQRAEKIEWFKRNEKIIDEVVRDAKIEVPFNFDAAISSNDKVRAKIGELAAVFDSDKTEERLLYNTKKTELVDRLRAELNAGVTPMDVHRSVMLHIKNDKKDNKELTQPQKVVAFVMNRDNYELWIDPTDRVGHVSVRVGGHWENYRLGERLLEEKLRAEYGRRYWTEVNGGRVPAVVTSSSLNEGIGLMRGLAAYRDEIIPALRVGGVSEDGKLEEVWVDLCNRDWELVSVTRKGWCLVTEGKPKVKFIRRAGMMALPIPRKGNIRDLKRFINVKEEDFVVEVGWLAGALKPTGPYPPQFIVGVAGAAKTTGSKMIVDIVDPNSVGVRPWTNKEDDMYIAAYNSWLPAYDNMLDLPTEVADVISRLSTGVGYAKRLLRTDSDQFMMRACRPILINGILPDMAGRSDLIDRAIVIELTALDEDAQRFEEELWAEFQEAKPRIIGALLDGVAGALQNYKAIDLKGYGRVRMADFARWAEAACRAMGFREGEFLEAFVANQAKAMRVVFERDPMAKAIALFMQDRGIWVGNTKPLFEEVVNSIQEAGQSELMEEENWPSSASWFGRDLRKSAAVLRKVCGIKIEFDLDLRKTGEGENGGLRITSSRTKKPEPNIAPVEPNVDVKPVAVNVAPFRRRI